MNFLVHVIGNAVTPLNASHHDAASRAAQHMADHILLRMFFVAWGREAWVLPPPLVFDSDEDYAANDEIDDHQFEGRRVDPMLGGKSVTFAEMSKLLAGEALSVKQLQEHWANLTVESVEDSD